MTKPSQRVAFVDTSAWFAIAAQRDANHAEAVRSFQRLTRERWMLVTTSYVVAETHALLLTRIGRRAGVVFLESMERGAIAVVRPDEEDEREGRAIVYRYADKTFSLTDSISFAVMGRLGIAVAFAFDRDFERYGLATL